MKSRILLLTLSAIGLTGCAESPQAAAPSLIIGFQADTAQTPDHIAECVYQAYKGKPAITIGDDHSGGMAITVTGVVYHLLLASLYHLQGPEAFADQLFHTVTPVLTVAGWLLFGPRALVDPKVVALSLVYPVAWLAFTLVRGALIGWYPYPFLQVDELGYGSVALNCAGITLLFLGLVCAELRCDFFS